MQPSMPVHVSKLLHASAHKHMRTRAGAHARMHTHTHACTHTHTRTRAHARAHTHTHTHTHTMHDTHTPRTTHTRAHTSNTPGEHVVLSLDGASVHGATIRELGPGDPLAEMAFFTETANLQVNMTSSSVVARRDSRHDVDLCWHTNPALLVTLC
jgi:hypothetical protein